MVMVGGVVVMVGGVVVVIVGGVGGGAAGLTSARGGGPGCRPGEGRAYGGGVSGLGWRQDLGSCSTIGEEQQLEIK